MQNQTLPQGNRKARRAVRCEDPDGGFRFTSLQSATADVARGVAKWGPTGILQYNAADFRVMAAARSRVSRPRYQNGDGFAPLEAIAGLPCIQPIRLLTGKRPASPPRDYPTVEISRRALTLAECSTHAVIAPWPLPLEKAG